MKIHKNGLVLLTTILITSLIGISFAQEEHHHEKAGHSHEKAKKHGGSVVMTKQFHFEVTFNPDAIRAYLYDGTQNPLQIKDDVSGTVVLKYQSGETDTLDLKQHSAHHMEGEHMGMKHHKAMGVGYLQADVDLSKVKPGSMKTVFNLQGLPSEKEPEVTFTETFNGFTKHKTSETTHKH